jgi:DNA-binding beta-propeller fold protein YncE
MMRRGITRVARGAAAVTAVTALGLAGAAVPAGAAAQAAGTRPALASRAWRTGCPATAYVLSDGPSGTVTPIRTATGATGPVIPIGNYPGLIAITPDGRTAYVSSDSGVTPIRTATGTAEPVLPVGDGDVNFIATTPDGRTAYVALGSVGDTGLVPVRTATNTPGPMIPLAGPEDIAFTPDGRTAYVTDYDGADPASSGVVPIRTATGTAGPMIPVADPGLIAITPDGRTIYVSSFDAAGAEAGTVTPIRTATRTAGPAISVGLTPVAIAITPDGRTAYVLSEPVDSTYQQPEEGSVTPIRIATNTPGPAIPVPPDSHAIAITPDGKTAYVLTSNYRVMGSNQVDPGSVTPIRTATNTPGPAIPDPDANGAAVAMVFSADGKTAYLLNSDEVIPVRTATNTLGIPIPVQGNATAIVITPARTAWTPPWPSWPSWPGSAPTSLC